MRRALFFTLTLVTVTLTVSAQAPPAGLDLNTIGRIRAEAVLDDAQREPIVIRRQDLDIAVVLSMADYERLRSGHVRGVS